MGDREASECEGAPCPFECAWGEERRGRFGGRSVLGSSSSTSESWWSMRFASGKEFQVKYIYSGEWGEVRTMRDRKKSELGKQGEAGTKRDSE